MKKTVIALVVGATFVLGGCNEPTAQESATKGQNLLAENNARAAGIEFKAALQRDPTNVDARVGLGKLALMERDFSGAMVEFQRAKEQQELLGRDAQMINELIARTAHRSEDVVSLMALEGKGNPEIAYYQIVRLTTEGKTQTARELFNSIENYSSAYTALANVLVVASERSPEEGMRLMPDVNDGYNDVQKSEYALLASGIALRNKDAGQAAEHLKTYHDLNPRDYERALQLSHILVREKQYDEAQPIVSELKKVFPTHGMISELDAIIAYEKEDFDRAISSATTALVSDPNQTIPRLILAYSAGSNGDQKTSLENLEFVIDELPAEHPAQRLYIKLKAETGELDGMADRALNLRGETTADSELLTNLGLELLMKGDVDSAKKLAEKAKNIQVTGDTRSSLGLLQLSIGDDEAFNNLEKAFTNNPESKIAADNLATAYLASERYEDAFLLGNKWVEEGKKVEGNMLKAVSKARMDQGEEAKSLFKQVLTDSPSHFMARAGVLEVEVQLGNDEKAEELFEQWVTEEGMAGLFRHYLSAIKAKRDIDGVKSALSHFDNLVNTGEVKSEQAYLLSAQVHYLIGEIKESKTLLDKITRTDIPNPDYWLLKASVNEQVQEYNAALDAYKTWQEIEPNLPLPVIGQVRILAKQNQLDDAITVLDSAMPNLNNQNPGRIMRMQLLIEKGDWAQLASDYTRLPVEVKSSAFGKAIAGVIAVRKGDFAAAEDIVPILKDYPNAKLLRWAVAGLAKTPQLNSKIAPLLESFTENNPNAAGAWFMLGNEYAGTEQFKRAIGPYERVAELIPDNAMVLNNLAYSQLQTGDISSAIKNAKKAVDKMPEEGSFLETLASALIADGRPSEAVTLMEDFIGKGFETNDVFLATLERARSS